MSQFPNILKEIPSDQSQELIETLWGNRRIRIERIVSQGHASPPDFWYDQDENEFILLIQGSARLQFVGEEPCEMIPGSYMHIPAHMRHRVDWTDPTQQTIWLAVFYPTR